jgi:DNA-binding protein H-NS
LDLNNLSLNELKKLYVDVKKAIDTYEDRMKKDALTELELKAKEMGFSLAELMGLATTARTRRPAAAKYCHPENSDITWSGRGRKPNWVAQALASGKLMSDLEV